MSRPLLDLVHLPNPALERIVGYSLSFGVSPLVLLTQLGSTISNATLTVLSTTLTIPDDDSVLVVIEQELEREGESRTGSSLVTSVATSHSHLVKHLEVVRPTLRRTVIAGTDEEKEEEEASFEEVPPLDEHGFSNFLERFPNLTSFTWRSYRLPSEDLCIDLANSAKNLRSFTFDLVPSPFGSSSPSSTIEASTLFGTSPCSPFSPSLHPLVSSATTSLLRWDCPSLSSLPGTLTSLTLSSLSHGGIQDFSNSLSSFFALEQLELSRTVFVDDHLLREISAGLSKSLKRFRIREMGGTKLSDLGLNDLFEACSELEEFEMDCVEGRLSRSCWYKIVSFPPRLRSIKIIYSESPPHKSWILDHLQSLPSLFSVSSLTSFTLSRKLHPESLVPGSHHPARHPTDQLLSPRKITREELEAISGTGGEGKRWIELDLDLILVDADGLKKLLDNCTELRRLKVCFDNQFKNLLALSSSFSACLHLQTFSVSIPLEHTPELQSLTPATYNPTVLSSPSISLAASPSPKSTTLPPLSPTSSPSKTLSPELPTLEQSLPESIQSLLPATRDWRRFLKKSHCLNSITWTGRGGIGKFKFSKIEGKGLIKIQFEPTPPLARQDILGDGGSIDGTRRERQDSWTSSFSLSSTSTFSPFGSPISTGEVNGNPFARRRRASSSSATTTHSPTTPTKSLASGRKYGSIDAAFSPSPCGGLVKSSTHRRASTTPASSSSSSSGFGIIGGSATNGNGTGTGTGTGTGAGTRRKNSFDHLVGQGQIGSGWSGFHSPTPTTSIPENDISPTSTFDSFFGGRVNDKVEPRGGGGGEGGGGLQMNLGPAISLDSQKKDDKSLTGERGGGGGSSKNNPWSSVPSSVTSPTPTPQIGWASPSPSNPSTPPRTSASSSTEKKNRILTKGMAGSSPLETKEGTGGPSSSKMSKGSRSSSSQGGGGSPTSTRSSRGAGGGGGGGRGGSTSTSNKNGNAKERGIPGDGSKRKDGGGSGDGEKRRRDRGGRSGRGARKEGGGVNA